MNVFFRCVKDYIGNNRETEWMTAVKTCCCFCHCLQCSGEQLVSMMHFHEALKSVRPSCLRSSMGRTELSPVTWEQIGGLDDVKLKLRQVAN